MIDWLQVASGLLGGGLLTAIGNIVLSNSKEKRENFDKIIQVWEEDNARLREQERVNSMTLASLQKEVTSLRAKINLLESTQVDFPFPMWLKDMDLTMLSVNSHFERLFLNPLGKTATDYIGQTDSVIFPVDIAKVYEKNDLEVLRTKAVFDGEEPVMCHGTVEQWRVIKYIRYAGGVPIGIAGICLPMK
jgi:hypothetical protein